ncbi:MAG: TonB-dependent receptor [Rhizomicrobium sp.]
MVTARRREEDIQTVPLSVTAIGAEDLKTKHIVSPNDLQYNVPSLNVGGAYGHFQGSYAIRGLRTGTTSYFSEVEGGPTDAGAPIFDMASIQILRGPQGTLFGRTNTAGAILFTPQHPEFNNWGGSLEITQGDLGRSEITGVLNIPLIDDHLAMRVAVNRQQLDGYTKVIGTNIGLDGTGNESVRIGLEWKPGSGWFTNYTAVNQLHVDETPGSFVLSAYNANFALFNLPANTSTPAGAAAGTATFGAVCATAVASGLSPSLTSCEDQRLGILAQYKPILATEYARILQGGEALRHTGSSTDIPYSEKYEGFTFVNKSTADLGDLGFSKVTLTNIFGYQTVTGASLWDVTGTRGDLEAAVAINSAGGNVAFTPSGNVVNATTPIAKPGPALATYTEEFHIDGNYGDNLLTWIVGAYYRGQPYVQNLAGIANITRLYGGALQPNLGYNANYAFQNGGFTRARGEFAQFTLDLSSFVLNGLKFTAGIRDSRDGSSKYQLSAVKNVVTGVFTPGAASAPAYSDSSGLGWTAALDYTPVDNLLLYATARRGYRPGGLNLVLGCSAVPNCTPFYGPETVKDVELGAKYTFDVWGVVGILNMDVYRDWYNNIQRSFQFTTATQNTVFTENVAGAVLQGVELETTIVPSESWEISGNYSYNGARYTNWVSSDPFNVAMPGNPLCLPSSPVGECLLDLRNNPFPQAPAHKGTLSVRYRVPIEPAAGDLTGLFTVFAQSRDWLAEGAVRTLQLAPSTGFTADALKKAISQPTFASLNFRIDWHGIYGSDFDGAVFVNNITNQEHATNAINQLFTLGVIGKIYAEPRTFGAQVTYRFGD